MEERMRNILVVVPGEDGAGLLAKTMAELSAANPGLEVITVDEARERAKNETFVVKPRPPMPIEPIIVKDNLYSYENKGLRSRTARRKAEREAKKKRRW